MKNKVALISLYDINSFAVRTLHSVLDKNNICVDSIFFKCNNPNNTMDIATEKEKEVLVDFIEDKKYNIIGISFRSLFTSLVTDICKRIKKMENPPLIVLGGVEPTINPDKFISFSDIIVIGEGEKTILDICNNKELSKIRNIYYKSKGKQVKNAVGCVEENLDNIPFPDFLDKNKYFLNDDKVVPLETEQFKSRYSLMTSRGCPFNCKYCCNNILRKIYNGNYVRRRSVDNVIQELKEAKKKFPMLNNISFWDDVFTFDKDWIIDFAKKYKEEINIPFFCFSNPNMCSIEVIKILKDAGLYSVAIGVQTFSNRIKNKVYGRFEDNNKIIALANEVVKNNISLSLDIILDNPMETEEDLYENFAWLLKINPPFEVHTHTLTYFPNTELTRRFLEEKLITEDDVEDNMEKGNIRWSLSMDLNRDKLNLFYDCLYVLTQSKFRVKKILLMMQRNKFLKNHPYMMAKFMRFFAYGLQGVNWNSRFGRYKFYMYQGVSALFHGDIKFIMVKMKQLINTPKVMNY